jgi:hypothetical protein
VPLTPVGGEHATPVGPSAVFCAAMPPPGFQQQGHVSSRPLPSKLAPWTHNAQQSEPALHSWRLLPPALPVSAPGNLRIDGFVDVRIGSGSFTEVHRCFIPDHMKRCAVSSFWIQQEGTHLIVRSLDSWNDLRHDIGVVVAPAADGAPPRNATTYLPFGSRRAVQRVANAQDLARLESSAARSDAVVVHANHFIGIHAPLAGSRMAVLAAAWGASGSVVTLIFEAPERVDCDRAGPCAGLIAMLNQSFGAKRVWLRQTRAEIRPV